MININDITPPLSPPHHIYDNASSSSSPLLINHDTNEQLEEIKLSDEEWKIVFEEGKEQMAAMEALQRDPPAALTPPSSPELENERRLTVAQWCSHTQQWTEMDEESDALSTEEEELVRFYNIPRCKSKRPKLYRRNRVRFYSPPLGSSSNDDDDE